MTPRRRRSLLLLGLAALAAIFAATLVAAYLAHGLSARDQPLAAEAFVARRLRHLAIPHGARAARNPVPLSSAVLAEARDHFADRCASCHSNDGASSTAIGQNLYPKAPDMRQAASQGLSDGEIFAIIRNGVRFTGMPAWGAGTPPEAIAARHLLTTRTTTESRRPLMHKKLAALLLLLAALFPALALAHGGHGHVMGTIAAVSADRLDVKTKQGKVVSVPLRQTTAYFKGDKKATAADLAVGTRVVAHLAADHAALEVHLPPAAKP